MRPLIGFNLDISSGPPQKAELQTTCFDWVFAAGGIPVLLPPMPDSHLEELFKQLSGLVLVPGDDYSPSLYGEAQDPKTILMDPKREDFDLRLIAYALKQPELAILAICGGCQLLNIGFGGPLIQDIPTEMPNSPVKHKGEPGWKVKDWHIIEIEPDTQLLSIYKQTRLSVPTAHHQGIKAVGSGLKVAARAEDGIIEALEAPDRNFVIGVQWHPERDVPNNEPLFKEFVLRSAQVTSTARS